MARYGTVNMNVKYLPRDLFSAMRSIKVDSDKRFVCDWK